MIGHVYAIIPHEFLPPGDESDIKYGVIKVGRTKDIVERYPNDGLLVWGQLVDNMDVVERKLLAQLRRRGVCKPRPGVGRKYFEGDVNAMLLLLSGIACNHVPSIELMAAALEEVNPSEV